MVDQDKLAAAGGRIRTAREANDLTLRELARLSGISPSALSLIETGKRDLRLSTLYRIAEALRLDVRDLVEQRAPALPQEDAQGGGYDLADYR